MGKDHNSVHYKQIFVIFGVDKAGCNCIIGDDSFLWFASLCFVLTAYPIQCALTICHLRFNKKPFHLTEMALSYLFEFLAIFFS